MHQTRCINCMKEIASDMRYCPYCGYDQQAECPTSFLRQNTILRGRYLVGRVIGKGGFGITYVGFDLTLEMKVAIKEYYPSGIATRNNSWSNQVQWESIGQDVRAQRADSMERVLKEARRTAKLADVPTVVRVIDAFCENETAYIVMDFIEGTTLKDYLKQHGVMTLEECEQLLFPIMEGLAAAHDIGIIHRDISPDNIMVRPDGTAKLLDLGAAVDISLNDGHASTLVVKNHFSALEQYDENGQLGSWTDVYAFASMLYYCMTGKLVPPVMDRILSPQELVFPAQSGVPAYVKEVLTKALAIKQEDRIQDMRAFEKALAQGNEEGEDKVHTAEKWTTQALGQEQSLTRNSNLNQAQTQNINQSHGQDMNQNHDQNLNQSHGQSMNQSHDPDMNQNYDPDMNQNHDPDMNQNHDPDMNQSQNADLDKNQDSRQIHTQNLTQEESQNPIQQQNLDPEATPTQAHEAVGDELQTKSEGDAAGKKSHTKKSTKSTGFKLKKLLPFAALFCVAIVVGVIIWATPTRSSNTNAPAMLMVDFNPEDGVLPPDYVLGSKFKRDTITEITFLDSLESEPWIGSWDVSEAGDGSVKAWVKQNHLYIAAEGGVIAPTDCDALFAGYNNLISIDFGDSFDTSQVTTMMLMFYCCTSLTELDLSSFDTSQVTAMASMFEHCSSLAELNVNGFDTSQVTSMSEMFYDCESLIELDVSGFDTSQVTSMDGMFCYCQKLTELDVSGFDTSQVTSMSEMFYDCESLIELNVTGFDTSQVTDMRYMFYSCLSLVELDVSGFDTSQVTDMESMFKDCSSLTHLTLWPHVSNSEQESFYESTGSTDLIIFVKPDYSGLS